MKTLYKILDWILGKSGTVEYQTYLEADHARWEAKAKREEERIERERRDMRTRNEMQMIDHWCRFCNNLMFSYMDELPKEDYDEWVLNETSYPFLPISFGDLLRRYKKEGKYLPATHLYLV